MDEAWDMFYDDKSKLLQKNPIKINDLFVNPIDLNDNNIPVSYTHLRAHETG